MVNILESVIHSLVDQNLSKGLDLPFWGGTGSIDLVAPSSQNLKGDKQTVYCNFIARQICDSWLLVPHSLSLCQTDWVLMTN